MPADVAEEEADAERKILRVMERFHSRFYTGDAAAVCRLYTAKAARETAAIGRKEDATCTEVMTAFAQPVTAEVARELKAHVVWVKVVGDRAVVKTTRNHAGRNIQVELTLVKRGEDWKFAEGLGGGVVETTPLDGGSL